ncbi:lymphocyte antigen 6 complex locus protein G6c [Phyllobates terribilis]|uniref:lymphocyte antigen 6 complex locus protein G6c n=1 Tax=Phyllobates terribilis TaxID=111132 RepID=UPI003CCAF0D6
MIQLLLLTGRSIKGFYVSESSSQSKGQEEKKVTVTKLYLEVRTMKTLFCISFALGLIAIASALTCKSCKFRVLSMCITKSSEVDCTGNCSFTKVFLGSFNLFDKQSCIANCQDGKNKTDSTFEFQYDNTCCNTNLCNSGTSAKMSVFLGLGMGLLWLLNAV